MAERTRWSEEDKAKLREMYASGRGVKSELIKAFPHKTYDSIKGAVRYLGLKSSNSVSIAPKTCIRWTQDKLNVLCELYPDPNVTIEEIIQKLQPHTKVAIRSKASELGIRRPTVVEDTDGQMIVHPLWRPRWSKEEDDFIRGNYRECSKEVLLGGLPGRTWDAVRRRARYIGVIRAKQEIKKTRQRRPRNKKPPMDTEWSEKELTLLNSFYPTASLALLAELIPAHSKACIVAKAIGLGYPRRIEVSGREDRIGWTDSMLNTLRTMYADSSIPTEDIVEAVGFHTMTEIYCKAKSMGLSRGSKVSHSIWPVEDKNKLKDLCSRGDLSWDDLASKLNRSTYSIRRKIAELKIDYKPLRSNGIQWTEELIENLKENAKTKSCSQTSRLLNLSEGAVRKKAKDLGITFARSRETSGNEWSEEDCEWLRSYYIYAPNSVISRQFPNRTLHAVRQQAYKLGCCRKSSVPGNIESLSDEDLELLISNLDEDADSLIEVFAFRFSEVTIKNLQVQVKRIFQAKLKQGK